MAKYFFDSAADEIKHAEKIEKYIVDHNLCVEYFNINKPQLLKENYELLDYFKTALNHEKSITASFKAMFEVAMKDKDSETQDFLDWFIAEQTEEEYKNIVIIERFELFKNVPSFVYNLDQEYLRK